MAFVSWVLCSKKPGNRAVPHRILENFSWKAREVERNREVEKRRISHFLWKRWHSSRKVGRFIRKVSPPTRNGRKFVGMRAGSSPKARASH
jgi:hypothetical protein